MKKLLAFLGLSLLTLVLYGQSVSLCWDHSSSAGVTGYKIYVGTNSGQYSVVYPVGYDTQYTITKLPFGRGIQHFMAATATNELGEESNFSNQITVTPPILSSNSPPILTGLIFL